MRKMDPDKEGEEDGSGNQTRRPRVTRNGSLTRIGRRRKVTGVGWPRVTRNGSLTRVGRRKSRSIEGVIKILGLILRSNEWHTILLLVPFVEVLGVGGGRRRRRPRRQGMAHGGGITTKVLLQCLSPAPVHGLLDRPAATHGEDTSDALGQTHKQAPALTLSPALTSSSPVAIHRTWSSGGARGGLMMRRMRSRLIGRSRASRPCGSPLSTCNWVVGVNPVWYIAGVFDGLLKASLGDHFDHLHDKGCIETPLERIPGSTKDLFPDYVKHVDAGKTVGSKEKKENPTLPKDIHLISALWENGHPRQGVKVPIVPMHVGSDPKLPCLRYMNKFLFLPHRQPNVMDFKGAALNVFIREAQDMGKTTITYFMPKTLDKEVHNWVIIPISFFIYSLYPESGIELCYNFVVPGVFHSHMFLNPFLSQLRRADVMSASPIPSHPSESMNRWRTTGCFLDMITEL
jgi:hypothetical protein